jgi:hypothetical protein
MQQQYFLPPLTQKGALGFFAILKSILGKRHFSLHHNRKNQVEQFL